jgi:hypothetical protein
MEWLSFRPSKNKIYMAECFTSQLIRCRLTQPRFILNAMAHAIKVDSPFATAEQTADTLGVSRSRANTLIKRARRIASKIVYRDARSGAFSSPARKERGTVSTSRPRNARLKATKSKSAKARR